MTTEQIILLLPYEYPFLFVDEILSINENSVVGTYTYPSSLPFYEGHFKDNPITPGVILTETMAQIGVVCLGIYIQNRGQDLQSDIQIAMTSNTMDYFIPVLPSEKITVKSTKEYFRFNKLKCKVEMYNKKDQLVCRGTISGMIKVK